MLDPRGLQCDSCLEGRDGLRLIRPSEAMERLKKFSHCPINPWGWGVTVDVLCSRAIAKIETLRFPGVAIPG